MCGSPFPSKRLFSCVRGLLGCRSAGDLSRAVLLPCRRQPLLVAGLLLLAASPTLATDPWPQHESCSGWPKDRAHNLVRLGCDLLRRYRAENLRPDLDCAAATRDRLLQAIAGDAAGMRRCNLKESRAGLRWRRNGGGLVGGRCLTAADGRPRRDRVRISAWGLWRGDCRRDGGLAGGLGSGETSPEGGGGVGKATAPGVGRREVAR